jgi:hypothetical protein
VYDFVVKIRELQRASYRFLRVRRVLDLMILFLIYYAAFSVVLPEYVWTSSILALATLIVYSKRQRTGFNLLPLIENAYPALRYRLSAAYDNREQDNVVMRDLSKQVSSMLDGVAYSSFFPEKDFLKRVGIILLLCFLVVSLAFMDVSMPASFKRLEDVPLAVGGMVDELSLTHLLGSGERNIFGEREVAALEGEEVTLRLYRGAGSELNVRELSEPTPTFETTPLFPVGGESAPLYVEEPIEHQEIVKKYFIKLSKSDIQ